MPLLSWHLMDAHRVLVVGGSGRVGGSAVRALLRRYPSSKIDVGGRKKSTWQACKQRIKAPDSVLFIPMDINDRSNLARIIPNYDLIINTAGPFQGLVDPSLLRETMINGGKYIDVCDDVPLSAICRSKDIIQLAKSTGGSAIISTGIWPGGSSLLAQEVIAIAGGHVNVANVSFSFFTAGSGGAGPTILTATFLILGEDVITYRDNIRVLKKSATDKRMVNFGRGIGEREVVRLSLIECESCHISGVPSVETFFGTAPPFWNSLFALMANIIPQKVLQSRELMQALAQISLPMVRLVDSLVGSTNGIRVDVISKDGITYTGLMTHQDLEDAVGMSIASFAARMLEGDVASGVFFPEEVNNDVFRKKILQDMKESAISYDIGQRID